MGQRLGSSPNPSVHEYFTTTLENTDPSFRYVGGWEEVGVDDGGEGTVQSTTSGDGYVELAFTGSSVQLLGAIGPNQGNYSYRCVSCARARRCI